MVTHVVEPGQTLTEIAGEYGLTAGLVARYNGLAPPYALAVGQRLLILRPRAVYPVQPGDTVSSVARAAGTTPLQLLRDNPNLQGDPALYPGQTLVLGLEEERLGKARSMGYAYPFVDPAILRGILPFAGALSPFTYGITEDGDLVALDDALLIALSRAYGVSPWLHLSTLGPDGRFSSRTAQAVLSSPASQDRLAEQVVRTMEEKGYAGLDVDFEYIGGDFAQAYAQWIGLLKERLSGTGKEVLAALAPKTSRDQPGVLYEGHDYALLGQAADRVLLMTYEWGYTYGPPMAVAPLPAVRRVVEFALSQIPAEKIYLGFPNYGYDWTLPYSAGVSRAVSISNQYAPQLAFQKGARIQVDEQARTPWFSYTDAAGLNHEVWFEDAGSAREKLLLVKEYGLWGVGFWNFMRPFGAGFSVLNALYTLTPP